MTDYKVLVPSQFLLFRRLTHKTNHFANMCKPQQRVHYLKDYEKPKYGIAHIDLDFSLDFTDTYVQSVMQVYRMPETPLKSDLIFDGHFKINLLKLFLKKQNGEFEDIIQHAEFKKQQESKLIIPYSLLEAIPNNEKFIIKTLVKINPSENTDLQGLYKSHDMLCTHCEADGFQAITFYLDRPDVMSTIKTVIRAPKKDFPILLCNGNYTPLECVPPLPEGVPEMKGEAHAALFNDPFKKPSYLFALVAGNLTNIQDTFRTFEGKNVALNLWCEPAQKKKLEFALDSLKKAMKWDEDRFGLAFDLDIFHLVAVSHFNMGAMENKGLNLFNSNCLLASKDTSTDSDFQRVLTCVSHEYFHNWTGNRVTCRDWFQITLKEGLTVYREQIFMEDTYSKAMSRLENVNVMQSIQAEEDSGPMAHPIQPKSYTAVDNFYTVTVYNKGSEVVRMYATILGEAGFRKGMDLYFKRHDGQGVTCDDFRNAMADANEVDLSQFGRWYSQVGTPIVEVLGAKYDPTKKTYTLTMQQKLPPYGVLDVSKEPLHIPIMIGLIGKQSKLEILPSTLYELKEPVQTFVIQNVCEEPIPSILRNYSAPVTIINNFMTEEDYGFLMAYDTDYINIWSAAKKLLSKAIINTAKANSDETKVELKCSSKLSDIITTGIGEYLKSVSTGKDLNFIAAMLTLPNIPGLMQQYEDCDPVILSKSRKALQNFIYTKFGDQMKSIYKDLAEKNKSKEYSVDSVNQGVRSLKNVLLNYITRPHETELAYNQFINSTNLTDRLGALKSLSNDYKSEHFRNALEKFYNDWADDSQCLEKYFAVQSTANDPSVLETVKSLLKHPKFQPNNPNHIRYVVEGYANNLEQFHDKSGKGYSFLADYIINLDKQNSRLAARIATNLIHYKRLNLERQTMIKNELKKILELPDLSAHTTEIVTKAL